MLVMVIGNYGLGLFNMLIFCEFELEFVIYVDVSEFCSVYVEIVGNSELDFILFCVLLIRWLVVLKLVMMMLEAREYSWIFRFKRKEGIYNVKSLGGNCFWISG